MSPTPPLPPNLKYLRLVLSGALHILETDGSDIRRHLRSEKMDYMVRALEVVEMGVSWASTRIDDMLAEEKRQRLLEKSQEEEED